MVSSASPATIACVSAIDCAPDSGWRRQARGCSMSDAFPPFSSQQAYVVVDVEADLRSEWTWNTKQMFVYVTVDFVTTRHPRNSVVMYSRIIQSKVRLAGTTAGERAACCNLCASLALSPRFVRRRKPRWCCTTFDSSTRTR